MSIRGMIFEFQKFVNENFGRKITFEYVGNVLKPIFCEDKMPVDNVPYSGSVETCGNVFLLSETHFIVIYKIDIQSGVKGINFRLRDEGNYILDGEKITYSAYWCSDECDWDCMDMFKDKNIKNLGYIHPNYSDEEIIIALRERELIK